MTTKTIALAPKPQAKTRKPAATEPAVKVPLSRQPMPAAPAKPVVAAGPSKAKIPPTKSTDAPHGKLDKKSLKPRPSLVRDSFTMPEADFALLAKLKSTALGARRAAKKSELLRAGLHLLSALDAKSLVATLDGLEAVKTGRPKKAS
jgi:hypothetical protein